MNFVFVLTLTPAALIVNECNCCCCYNGFCLRSFCAKKEDEAKKEVGQGKIEEISNNFFRRRILPTYQGLIENKTTAATMVVVGTIYLVLSCVWASMLTPPNETEKWLPKRHMLERAFDMNEKFVNLGFSQYAEFHTVWGMKKLVR
jgi:hypothetical protein